jgi:hypothetical protein
VQRKRRQQNRRTELNQRRAMVLPDGSAAPGAMPTYSGGSQPPPAPLRPNNMLAAIQNMPPQEKRAMLVSALKRALPIMMQTAQVSQTSQAGMRRQQRLGAASTQCRLYALQCWCTLDRICYHATMCQVAGSVRLHHR